MVTETMEAALDARQCRIICWRQLNLPDLFPDHPRKPQCSLPFLFLNRRKAVLVGLVTLLGSV
jgi:hypothetical protein